MAGLYAVNPVIYKTMLNTRAQQGDQAAAQELYEVQAAEAARPAASSFGITNLPWYYLAALGLGAVGVVWYATKGK